MLIHRDGEAIDARSRETFRMVQRYFEDFVVGEVIPLGSHQVTRPEIIAFAAEFDPQPFHLDERQGAGSIVDGLIASGWHVSGLFMRMLCDGFLLESSSLGSPGVETLKWRKPVRAGDTLIARATVIEARRSKSRPEMGIVRFRSEVENQAGEIVMWLENAILFGCREVK
jgi:acyl dehydratase